MPNIHLKPHAKIVHFFAGGVLLLSASFMPAHAQVQDPDPKAVVATVGGEQITQADLNYVVEDMGQDIARIKPEERRSFLIDMLVDMKLMAQAARKAGMQDTQTFKQRQNYLMDRALRRAYLQDVMAQDISEDALKAAYDAAFKDFQPKDTMRARHILVASEDDAKAVVEELNTGKPFEDVAKEKSTGPTGANGGDLGYFSEGDMVKEFYEAAKALEVGAISAPVQTQFGWHVIKLEDRRPSTPPTLEQVKPQLRQQVLGQKIEAQIEKLKADTKVEIMQPAQ